MSSSCADGKPVTISSIIYLIFSPAFEQHSRVKRARTEDTASLGTDVVSEYRHMQRGFMLASTNIESIAGLAVSEVDFYL
jgi:hypothetical protein